MAPFNPQGHRAAMDRSAEPVIWCGSVSYRGAVVGKLGLVVGVAAAWLLTFVFMGGDVLPAIGGDHAKAPSAHATLTPTTSYPNPTPIGPSSASGTPSASASDSAPGDATDSPGQEAQSAEAAARVAALAGQTLEARPKPRRSPPPVAEFRMATFNVLGSSHTRHGARAPAPGSARMARSTAYVLDNDISLVGFQEMQPDQRSVFLRDTGGKYGLYPGNQLRSLDGDNSIAWRLDTWDLVKAETIPIPYFGGAPRNMPILTLRNKVSGVTIILANFHNPADTAEFGKQGKWRAAAKAKEAVLFGQLRQRNLPLFVTGDMNETQSWFCAVAGPGDLKAAAGGEGGRSGCSVAGGYRIDWIAASHDVEFTGYREDKSGYVHWMTDHPVVSADVRVDSRLFPKSVVPAA